MQLLLPQMITKKSRPFGPRQNETKRTQFIPAKPEKTQFIAAWPLSKPEFIAAPPLAKPEQTRLQNVERLLALESVFLIIAGLE
jgi:hypothetical protein